MHSIDTHVFLDLTMVKRSASTARTTMSQIGMSHEIPEAWACVRLDLFRDTPIPLQ